MKKHSKEDDTKLIEDFFLDISNKSSSEVKKIIKLANSNRIKLGSRKKLFCKRCFNPYKDSGIRINKGIKSVECKNCDYKNRWKVKLS